jgi:hypothetical protein
MPMARPELATLMTRLAVVLWVSDPLAPAMVSVEVPAGVPAAVVTVSVALPAPTILDGLKEADELAGSPVALRLTVPLKPFSPSMMTV